MNGFNDVITLYIALGTGTVQITNHYTLTFPSKFTANTDILIS